MTSMLFLNERYWVRNVAAQWRKQYVGAAFTAPDKLEIMRKLDALDTSIATADEVDAIIGNVTWTTQPCTLCRTQKRELVVFGTDFNRRCALYHEDGASLCVDCVSKLHDFIKASTAEKG